MRPLRVLIYMIYLLSAALPVLAQSPARITSFGADRQSVTPDEAESGAAYVNLNWATSQVAAGQTVKLQVLVLGQWIDAQPAGMPPLNPVGTLRWAVPHTLDFIAPTFRLVILDSAQQLIDTRELVIPYSGIDSAKPPKIAAFNTPVTAIKAGDFSRADFTVPVNYQVANRPARANVTFEQVLDSGKVVSIELPRFNTWIRSGGNGVVKPVADGGDVVLRISLASIDTREVYAQQTLTIPVIADALPVPQPTGQTPQQTPDPTKADVVRFTSSAYNLKRGDKITLTWEVKNSDSIRLEVYDIDYFPLHYSQPPLIKQENLPATGSTELTIPADYAGSGYQLHLLADNTANPGYDFIRLDIVFTDAPQQVMLNMNSFTVSPETAKRGDTITLNWDGYVVQRVSHDGTIQWDAASGYEKSVYLDIFGNGVAPLPVARQIRDLPVSHGSATFTIPADFEPNASFVSIQLGLSGVMIQGKPTDVIFGITNASLIPSPDAATTDYVEAAFQQFEGGMMIWNAITGEVLVYTGTNGGEIIHFPLDSYSSQPDNPVTDAPPAERLKPVNAFGRVWGNNPNIRNTLGWAVSGETGYTMIVIAYHDSPQALVVTLPNSRKVYHFRNNWNF